MAKKKKVTRLQAHNELKTLESKWLKDSRLLALASIPDRVTAAKIAAVLDYAEQNKLSVELNFWPIPGFEELIKLDQPTFNQGLGNLQKAGILNDQKKIRKVHPAGAREIDYSSESGEISYRCVKPGGVTLPDRDEYVQEEQEVTYSEEAIAESGSLQNAIANGWLMRVDELQ